MSFKPLMKVLGVAPSTQIADDLRLFDNSWVESG